MAVFSNEALNKIQTALEKEKKNVLFRIGELSEQDPFSTTDRLSDNAASDVDAAEEEGHSRAAALIETLKNRVVEIEATLARIADGTYGVCEQCGLHIEPERLMALPTATLCLACEKAKEK